jgi:probable phosphoglycerate mutase
VAIYVVRHGLSQGNEDGYFQGQLDPPLAKRGLRQAQALGQWLGELRLKVAAVYTSPLRRAAETADVLARLLGTPAPVPTPELKEYSGGELEGKTKEELAALFPDYPQRPLADRGDFAQYGGESYQRMQRRLKRFIERVHRAHAREDDLLVVAHGGTIYQLLKRWCGRPAPRHYFTRISNCVCFKLVLREILGQTVGELTWMVPLELIDAGLSTSAAEARYPPAE